MQTIVPLIPRLRRFARALIREPNAADDLVQDTLERACAKFSQYREGTNLRAWLFSIMHSVFINGLKAPQARAAFEPIDDDFDIPVADFAQLVEIRDFIVTSLWQLSAEHREVLILIAVEDVSYEEAASVLGVPVGTVKSRVTRARMQLMKLVGETSKRQPELRLVGRSP